MSFTVVGKKTEKYKTTMVFYILEPIKTLLVLYLGETDFFTKSVKSEVSYCQTEMEGYRKG